MRIWVIALPLLLSACVTGQVVPTGKDSYSLSASRCGLCEPVQGYVIEQASAYCKSINKHMMIRYINADSRQPMFPGSATIFFSCLNADDPQYQAPQMRKDNGVTTIQIQ